MRGINIDFSSMWHVQEEITHWMLLVHILGQWQAEEVACRAQTLNVHNGITWIHFYARSTSKSYLQHKISKRFKTKKPLYLVTYQ